jgi:hypothetical protein
LLPTILALVLSLSLAPAAVSATSPPATAASSANVAVDPVLSWFDVTKDTVTAAALPAQVTNSRLWALGWVAADRAISAAPPTLRNGPYAIAALAGAVHQALVESVPARKAELDDALSATLAALPPGPLTRAGRKAGEAAAAGLLAERAGDGLDLASINPPFTPPPEAPGVWRPTPPGYGPAVLSGEGRGRPFLLDRADRFRPDPPLALGTAGYRADLAEVQAYGGADSTVRTPEQTSVALLWEQSSLSGFTQVLRAVIDNQSRPLAARVHLLSVFQQVTIDAQIAVYEAKYFYLWWRPVTAIRAADTDGDPLTAADPAWTPLIVTPSHPEYPSGHATYAAAAAAVLRALAGPRPARPITVASPADPGLSRTYPDWDQLVQDNVDARVWSGVHFRTTDQVSAQLGRRVADYDLLLSS